MEMIGDGVVVDLADAAFLGAQHAGEIAEVIDRERQVGGLGLADRLAVVDGLDHGQHVELLLDAVGDAQQRQRALRRRGVAPGVLGGVRGVKRQFDVLGGGARHRADDIAVDRRNVLEGLALDRGHPLAADEIVVMRPDRNLATKIR